MNSAIYTVECTINGFKILCNILHIKVYAFFFLANHIANQNIVLTYNEMHLRFDIK